MYIGILLIDVGAIQQIVESADSVAPVGIAFDHDPVFTGLVSPAVVLRKARNFSRGDCLPKSAERTVPRIDVQLIGIDPGTVNVEDESKHGDKG